MKKYYLALIAFISVMLFAQCASQRPGWVKAMDKPNVNYYKACKKFDRYWSKHLPVSCDEEDYERGNKSEVKGELEEELEGRDNRPFYVKLFQSREKAQERSNGLNIERKGFEKWRLEKKPYIKEDGSLMTPEERIAAWEQFNNM